MAVPSIHHFQWEEHSDVERRDRQGGVKERHEGEKAKHHHDLKRKKYMRPLTVYTVAVKHVFLHKNSQNICKQYAQSYTNTVFRCHLAPDPQSIMEAARKQCWGARSDRANRKQAAFCIPGQAAQHNTDTGRDTETHHLWPKTIHLPCSPRRDDLWWIGFFYAPRHSCHLWGLEASSEKEENEEKL